MMERYSKNGERLKDVKYFRKKHHHRCLAKSKLRLSALLMQSKLAIEEIIYVEISVYMSLYYLNLVYLRFYL